MISIIGNDKSGKDILKNLQDNNVDTSCVKVSKEAKSDSASLYVSISGDNNIIRSRESIDEFDINLIKENEEVIKNADCVVTQTKVPREVYTRENRSGRCHATLNAQIPPLLLP